jgi:acyl-CoA synthetase (AMP-forming)/AMP-acid ligase II
VITAQRLVERSLVHFGARLAVVDGPRRVTYDALAERTARLCTLFASGGATRDRPVTLWMPNCLEFVECDVACMRAGVPRVAVGDRLAAEECAFIIAHSGTAVVVTTATLYEQLHNALPDTVALTVVVGMDHERTAGSPLGYEQGLAQSPPMTSCPPAAAGDPSYILYTSGTTGRPKGAEHSQGGRIAGALNMLASELRHFDDAPVYLHVAPMSHGSGAKLLPTIAAGGCSVTLPRFEPETVAYAVQTEHVTHTFVVPTILQRLLDAGPGVHEALRELRQVTFGGSPIAPQVFRTAVQTFGPILTQIYGSSEMPHPVAVLRPEDYAGLDDRTLKSAGRAVWGVDLRIVDRAGAPASLGDPGELLIAGSQAMTGYWRDPEATNEVTADDGFYRSGDVAVIDDDGLVTLQDRQRDLVISGGLNIYPSEVERVLSEHPQVQQVAVVGAPDADWGETVVAFVVVRDSSPLTADDLLAWARPRLASYKKPRRIHFVSDLPVGPTGKVLKRGLRDELWRGHERQIG